MNIKWKALIMLNFFVSIATSGCFPVSGSGNVVPEERTLPPFHSVLLEGRGEVYISEGAQTPLKIESDDNIIPIIYTTVEDGVLKIGLKSPVFIITKLKITISMPEYKSISLAGSGKAFVQFQTKQKSTELSIPGSGEMKVRSSCEDLKIHLGGSGNLSLEGDADTASVLISGSGNVWLSGKGKSMKAKIGGSGNINAESFLVSECDALINGSGNCFINVTDSLKASIAGSGTIRYLGNPRTESSISGSGVIKPK